MPIDLSKYCTRVRMISGVTQEEFAERCGVTVSTVSRWETGKSHPSAPALEQIREIYVRNRPLFNSYVIEASPAIRFAVETPDLRVVVCSSKGLLAYRNCTFEEFRTLPPSADYNRLTRDMQAHPDYIANEMAYCTATIESNAGWVDVSGVLDQTSGFVYFDMHPTDKRAYEFDVVSIRDMKRHPPQATKRVHDARVNARAYRLSNVN